MDGIKALIPHFRGMMINRAAVFNSLAQLPTLLKLLTSGPDLYFIPWNPVMTSHTKPGWRNIENIKTLYRAYKKVN